MREYYTLSLQFVAAAYFFVSVQFSHRNRDLAKRTYNLFKNKSQTELLVRGTKVILRNALITKYVVYPICGLGFSVVRKKQNSQLD